MNILSEKTLALFRFTFSILVYSTAILAAYLSIHYIYAEYVTNPGDTYIINLGLSRKALILAGSVAGHLLFGSPLKFLHPNCK